MFRYYCSDSYPHTLTWSSSNAGGFEEVVKEHYRNNYVVPDADNDGEGSAFLVVKSEAGEVRYFKLEWTWTVDFASEEFITNDFTIAEVSPGETENLVGDRDWLKINHFPPYNSWPPTKPPANGGAFYA